MNQNTIPAEDVEDYLARLARDIRESKADLPTASNPEWLRGYIAGLQAAHTGAQRQLQGIAA